MRDGTPGPWHARLTADGWSVATPLADLARLGMGSNDSDFADASMMAAAPQLYELVKAMADYVGDHIDINNNGGPNWAMRMAQEFGDRISVTLKKAQGD